MDKRTPGADSRAQYAVLTWVDEGRLDPGKQQPWLDFVNTLTDDQLVALRGLMDDLPKVHPTAQQRKEAAEAQQKGAANFSRDQQIAEMSAYTRSRQAVERHIEAGRIPPWQLDGEVDRLGKMSEKRREAWDKMMEHAPRR